MAADPSSREHLPIQIGLPPEPAWAMARPVPTTYIAFVAGDEMPDPGEAFLAAGRAFGAEPAEVEPLGHDDARVAWAFAFSVPGREARVMLWCEAADAAQLPDGAAADARWVVFVETILDAARAVDDAVALASTAAGTARARTRLLLDPAIGSAWSAADLARLFFGEGSGSAAAPGALVDERFLYRIEVVARDRANGPYWLTTVGLARLARPELEMLEVPAADLRAALELVDALAARFVGDEPPRAGVPHAAGPGVKLALGPVAEAIEALAAGAPAAAADRRAEVDGPRAAICAAGRRGSFRAIWVPPLDELARLSRHEAGLYLAPRVTLARERLAQAEWPRFVATRAAVDVRAPIDDSPDVTFLAKVAVGDSLGERRHLWVAVDAADLAGGSGVVAHADAARASEPVAFALAAVGDWRVLGLGPDRPDIGPERAALLADA